MEEEVYGGREERPPLRLLLSDQSKVVRVKCVVIRAGFLRQGWGVVTWLTLHATRKSWELVKDSERIAGESKADEVRQIGCCGASGRIFRLQK
jgi:hypothetical protein